MLEAVKLSPNEIAAALVAISFAAGLNVYATLATLGILAHVGVLPLPPALHLVTSWWVIGTSLGLFTVEFFADKIPAFDLIWNALHTFIRVPVAALLAYGATSQLSPEKQWSPRSWEDSLRWQRTEARPPCAPPSRPRQSPFRTSG